MSHATVRRTLAVLLLAATTATADDAVSLEWTWKKKAVLRYRMIQEHLQKSSAAPHLKEKSRQTADYRFDVTDVTRAGLATVEATCESVKMEYDAPTGTWSYDSNNPEDASKASIPLFMPASLLAGSRFVMKIDRSGRVHELMGFERYMENILAPRNESRMPPALRRQIKHLFSDASMKQLMETALHVLPDEAVTEGESWKRELSADLPTTGTMSESATYKLKAVEDTEFGRVAVVSSSATLSLEPEPAVDGSGAPLKPRVELKSGRAEGTMSFSLDRGCILKQEQKVIMRMESRSRVRQAGTQGEPVEMVSERLLTQKITLEFLAE